MAMILSIGNTLLKDEGIGIYLLNYSRVQNRRWELDEKIEMIDGGTLSFDVKSTKVVLSPVDMAIPMPMSKHIESNCVNRFALSNERRNCILHLSPMVLYLMIC